MLRLAHFSRLLALALAIVGSGRPVHEINEHGGHGDSVNHDENDPNQTHARVLVGATAQPGGKTKPAENRKVREKSMRYIYLFECEGEMKSVRSKLSPSAGRRR